MPAPVVMNRKTPLAYLSVLLCIEIVLLLLSWQTTYFHNRYLVTNPDNLASADVARNIVAGHGYRTGSLSLYEVALYDKKGWLSDGPPWKNTYRFPLPALSMAALFKIFGDSHLVANFLYPSLFHLLSVVALFALSYLLFQNGVISFIASFVFMTVNDLLYTAIRHRSDSADIFFFVLSLIAFFQWRYRQKVSSLFLLGLIVGFSFLNRFNEGAILFLTFPIVIFLRTRLNLRQLAFYASGFLIPILPFLVYNMKALGVPFFSSNSYFQFVDASIVSKYMNPFWKLHYGVDVMNPFTYVLSNPGDFLKKALHYVFDEAFKPFVKFGGSFWLWIPVAYASVLIRDDKKIKELEIIFIIVLLLHVLLIAPLGLTVYYIQFLYIPLIVVAAKTLHEWYISNLSPEVALDNMRSVSKERKRERFFLFVTMCTTPLSLYGRVSLEIFILISLFASVVASISLLKKRPRRLFVCFSLIVLLSSALYIRDYANKFSFKAYTTNEHSELRQIEKTTSQTDIVLTTLFWNTAWFSKRPSIPIPEYPDEIYLLIKKYNLNIRIIYLSSVDVFVRYSSRSIPLSYYSYNRLTEKHLPIRGFSRIEPSVQGNLLLYRDDDPLKDIMNTKVIDFGGLDGASHLVYGFSPPAMLGSSIVCWIVRDDQWFFFARNKFRFFKDQKIVEYDNPDAEMTFLRENAEQMKHMRFRIFSVRPEEAMTIVLNANLFSYEDKGVFVATVSLHKGWNLIDVPMMDIHMRDGLNKLSFWLKQEKGSLSFSQSDAFRDALPGWNSLPGTLGVAFDKAFFE